MPTHNSDAERGLTKFSTPLPIVAKYKNKFHATGIRFGGRGTGAFSDPETNAFRIICSLKPVNWYILVKNEIPACLYLSISRYKNTIHTFHISIELLLMFLIWKSLCFIFSQQYSQVLLNENLKCLKSEAKEKMKNNYLYRCYYVHSKDSFLFIACRIQ